MTQPEVSNFFGYELQRGSSLYFPKGAGVYLFSGNMMVSTAHADIIYLFWVYVNGLAVYTYATLDLKIDNEVTRRVRLLWVLAFGFSFLWTLSILSVFYIDEVTNVLVIFTFFLEIFIAFRYPQAMLLSHVQVKRASDNLEQYYVEIEKNGSKSKIEPLVMKQIQQQPLDLIFEELNYDDAKMIYHDRIDTPHALYILGKSVLIQEFTLSEKFATKNQAIIGNLISAILTFSQEILNPNNESRIYRFQSEEFNLTALRFQSIIICYVFEGYAPLAEIRLRDFVTIQESLNMDRWDTFIEKNFVVFTLEEINWLDNEINQNFLKGEQNVIRKSI